MSRNSTRAFAPDSRVVATLGAPRDMQCTIVYKHIHYRKGFAPQALAPSRINGFIRRVSSSYARFSTKRPYVAASMTAGSILTSADYMAQRLEGASASTHRSYDYRRTVALGSFGFFYYGGPCKFLYLLYDKLFTSVAAIVVVDVCIHTPFVLIPTFYAMTLTIKGVSKDQMLKQLKDEWVEASSGSLCFWVPTCTVNFMFVPQHSRIFVVSIMSFFHKTWLSWVSNRKRVAELQLAKAQEHPALLSTTIGTSPSSLPVSLPFSTAV